VAALSTTVTNLGPIRNSVGTCGAGDNTFTFADDLDRFWVHIATAAVAVSFASASSGAATFTWPIGHIAEYRIPDLAGRTVTFVGNTAVVEIVEYRKKV